MNKPDVSKMLSDAKSSMIENAPKILTGVGIFGMIGTTVMAVSATPKALQLIEKKKDELHTDKLPPVEIIKVTWKFYIPAFVTCVTSAACLIKANSISTRRNAALVTAYNLSATALREYKDKVVETIGEKKEQAIQEEISKDKLKKDPVHNHEVVITERGDTLCYDGVFGRYFRSNVNEVKRAITEINRQIVTSTHGYASLNDFYDELGIGHTDIGDDLGWSLNDGEIDIDIDYAGAADGTPCLVIRYTVAPRREYWKYS